MTARLGLPVVYRPGLEHDERWGPGQLLSGVITAVSGPGEEASIVVFPDTFPPYFEMKVSRDDALSKARTYTPAVGESQTLPEAPVDGQIYGRRNQAWEALEGTGGGASFSAFVISDTPPAQPVDGMAWWDSTINNLYVWMQEKWVEPAHINPT